MRTEEWQQTQNEMISTAIVDVFEPGDRIIETIQHDSVLISHDAFQELAEAAGYTHATT